MRTKTILLAALGAAIATSRLARELFAPTAEFLRPLPASAIIPPAILLLGLSETMIVAVIAFGAVTPILWEGAEYFTFIRDNPKEFSTAYTDTLGDLAMSLSGTIVGAILTATVLWGVGLRMRAQVDAAR